MKILTVIPARRDSKGIPGKNWKPLNGKPLIGYTIESALEVSNIQDICLTTNSLEVIDIAKNTYNLNIPFVRPEELSTDFSPTRDALLHTINYFETTGIQYDTMLLLQPTSPFRNKEDIIHCIQLFEKSNCEMVVSVAESPVNPYYNLYIEDEKNNIHRAIPSNYSRRQDCPPAYIITGSIYVISIEALKKNEIFHFQSVKKVVTSEKFNIDLDTETDWKNAEKMLIEK